MTLPSSYESVTGAVLERLRSAVRRNPSGVDIRAVEPVRIEIVIVPVLRGAVPRSYGQPGESVLVEHSDPETANALAFERVQVIARSVEVLEGRAAVLARRIGGDQ
jgi:hypothetical protein